MATDTNGANTAPSDAAGGHQWDGRRRAHIIEFAGGMGSAVGRELDERLRRHPAHADVLRMGAFDTCLNDNQLFGRRLHSPWLSEYTLGEDTGNFHDRFEQHREQWSRDLPLEYLASAEGILGSDLAVSGVNKRPPVSVALNAMEAPAIQSWMSQMDNSFDSSDRSLLVYNREATYVAGTGGTGLASAIMHAGWRSMQDNDLHQRLMIYGPQLYHTAGDPVRERRHQLIMASAARSIDRMALLGTDPKHPHFGGLLPGFERHLPRKFVKQVMLIEGSNGRHALTLDDARRMGADWLYYLAQVPELAAKLAVETNEHLGMVEGLVAASRTPFIWGSMSFHVVELWRDLPHAAELQRRCASLSRMRKGSPAASSYEFRNPISAQPTERLYENWERRFLTYAASRIPVPLFDHSRLGVLLGARHEDASADAVAAIKQLPAIVDEALSGAVVADIAGASMRGLREAIQDALPLLGVERVLSELAETRVSLGDGGQEIALLSAFMDERVEQEILDAGSAIKQAAKRFNRAKVRTPGFIGDLFGAGERIESEREEAASALNGLVTTQRNRVAKIASSVLHNSLRAKLGLVKSHHRVALDQIIRTLTDVRTELKEKEDSVRARAVQILEHGRIEKSATRFSLFPDEEVLARSARVDEQQVAAAFKGLLSWGETSSLHRTERALDDILASDAPVHVSFAELLRQSEEGKSFFADNLHDGRPFVRINPTGLQGLKRITERIYVVYPKALQPFVDTLRVDRKRVHCITADIPAMFVFRQVDSLPSSAIQSLCEYDSILQAALEADKRERSEVAETMLSSLFGRYRRAKRIVDTDSAKHHQRAAAALVLSPDGSVFDPANPAEWARVSFVAKDGSRVPILGPGNQSPYPKRPLYQDDQGIWCVRFRSHQGALQDRSLRTPVLAYALDLIDQSRLYQAAIAQWISGCAKTFGPGVRDALGAAVTGVERWCKDVDEAKDHLADITDEKHRSALALQIDVLPEATLMYELSSAFNEPEEWFLDFGVTYDGQVLFPNQKQGGVI